MFNLHPYNPLAAKAAPLVRRALASGNPVLAIVGNHNGEVAVEVPVGYYAYDDDPRALVVGDVETMVEYDEKCPEPDRLMVYSALSWLNRYQECVDDRLAEERKRSQRLRQAREQFRAADNRLTQLAALVRR